MCLLCLVVCLPSQTEEVKLVKQDKSERERERAVSGAVSRERERELRERAERES